MGAVSHGGTDARGFDKEFTRWTVPNVETLSGNKTITSVDARVQLLNPNGASRNVTLDASLHVEGTVVEIHATNESDYAIAVYNSAAVLIAYLRYDQTVKVVYASGSWRIINLPYTAESGAARSTLYVGFRNGVTQLVLGNASVNKQWVDSTGVGIGAAPSSLFHVTASGNANALRVDNTTGQVLVGASAAITSASAVFGSATGAIVLNRWTTTERDALTATKGMMGYNTTTDKAQIYNGAWVDLH